MTPLLLYALLCAKIVSGEDNEGQQIANKLGDDLSFASKQFIRGFTAIFGPVLDTLQGPDKGEEGGMPNFRRVIFRDGINAIGKGAKAGATILSAPARVAGTGIEEAKKVAQAGMGSSRGQPKYPPVGDTHRIDEGAKVVSTLLNTTSSELSQANLGAVLLEVAVKKRIQDIGNKTTSHIQGMRGTPAHEEPPSNADGDSAIKKREEETTTKSSVDELLVKFNEAVKQNDERVMNALKSVLASINPPKN